MSEWAVANHIVQINDESGFVQVVDETTLTALQQGVETSYRIRETDFLWTAAVAVSTGTFRCRVFSATESRYLDTNPVRSENFWGTAQEPMRHPPKFLPLNGELTFKFDDTSGAGNVVALYLWGKRANTCGRETCARDCRCDRARWGQGRGLFVMHTPGAGVVIPASSGTSSVLKVPDYYHVRATIQNGFGTSDSFKWQLSRMDPRDERRASPSNAQQRRLASLGTATKPARLPSPIILHKGSQAELDWSDQSGSANTAHLALIGETLDDELVRQNG